MKYLVSHQGEQLGPISATDIVAKISARELDVLDFGFDEIKNDWVLLTELPDVAVLLKARKPAAPARPAAAPAVTTAPTATDPHAIPEWFVLKGEAKFGPFATDELVGLLQQKSVYPFDFCWHAGMAEWTRVADVAQFKPDQIRNLKQTNSSVFIERRFARAKFAAEVILHDGRQVWRARARELSGGGIGVNLRRAPAIAPGQTLSLHCAAHDGLPAFNATCEVVAIAVVGDDSAVEYGLRFLELSPDAQASINSKVA